MFFYACTKYQIHQLSFSPHTDSKGIMDLVKFLSPKHVILVHGEKPKMAQLKSKIESELSIPCYHPANNEAVSIPSAQYVKADASDAFIKGCMIPHFEFPKTSESTLKVRDERVGEGVLIIEKGKKAKVIHQDELIEMLGEKRHDICFAHCCPIQISNSEKSKNSDQLSFKEHYWLGQLLEKLSNEANDEIVQDCMDHLECGSICISICSKDKCPFRTDCCENAISEIVYFCCSWKSEDEKLAWRIISIMETLKLSSTNECSEGSIFTHANNIEAGQSC